MPQRSNQQAQTSSAGSRSGSILRAGMRSAVVSGIKMTHGVPPMRLTRVPFLAVVIVGLVLGVSRTPSFVAAVNVPKRLSDAEFWTLTENLSEPDGYFRSENLLSNEMVLPLLLPEVIRKVKPGGVYLGVGPEQNFSYLSVIKPKIAFIIDIRRGNLHVILMYKALFELSADRAEFVFRLFTRARPAGLSASSTVREIMDAARDASPGSEADFAANLKSIHQHLALARHLPLSAEDLEGIGSAYRAFYFYGPAMNYSASTDLRSSGFSGGNAATYWDLMTQAGADGTALSYLGSEPSFRSIKDL